MVGFNLLTFMTTQYGFHSEKFRKSCEIFRNRYHNGVEQVFEGGDLSRGQFAGAGEELADR